MDFAGCATEITKTVGILEITGKHKGFAVNLCMLQLVHLSVQPYSCASI